MGEVAHARIGGGEGRTQAIETAVLDGQSEWLAVGMFGADGPMNGTVRLYADPGVVVLGRGTGPAALHRIPDFEGTTVWARSLVTARVIQDASLEVEASSSLFAFFTGGSNTGWLQMGIEGPERAWAGDTLYTLANEPPGRYTFAIEENVDVSVPCPWNFPQLFCGPSDIWVLAGDVRAP